MLYQGDNNPSGYRILILLLLISGAAALLISCASAGTGITISADGDQSYYLGEKVVLRGQSPDADTVYLILTGPKDVLPATGAELTSPNKGVVSGNPDSFTLVKTKPDKTWEYAFYTANLKLDAGTYTIYAVNQPKAKDQLGPAAANVGMALKKPFITAEISSSNVVKGQPFTVTGIAEGIPPEVQIWIIGDTYCLYDKNAGKFQCIVYLYRRCGTIGKPHGRAELSHRPAPDGRQSVRLRCQRGLCPQPETEQRHECLQAHRPGKPAGQRCGRRTHRSNQRSGGKR